VFATALGHPLDSRHATQGFQAALARAGLRPQRFHDLRHTYATLLIEQGEELGVVSKILGHSDLGTTADVYAHLTMSMTQRAADRIDGVLRRRPAAG
jgi:integrase